MRPGKWETLKPPDGAAFFVLRLTMGYIHILKMGNILGERFAKEEILLSKFF